MALRLKRKSIHRATGVGYVIEDWGKRSKKRSRRKRAGIKRGSFPALKKSTSPGFTKTKVRRGRGPGITRSF